MCLRYFLLRRSMPLSVTENQLRRSTRGSTVYAQSTDLLGTRCGSPTNTFRRFVDQSAVLQLLCSSYHPLVAGGCSYINFPRLLHRGDKSGAVCVPERSDPVPGTEFLPNW